jgi:hypothetical protein
LPSQKEAFSKLNSDMGMNVHLRRAIAEVERTTGQKPDLSQAQLDELERQVAVVLEIAKRYRNVLHELAKS